MCWVDLFYLTKIFRRAIVSILHFHVVIAEWYSLEALLYRRQEPSGYFLNRLLLNQFYSEDNSGFIFIASTLV